MTRQLLENIPTTSKWIRVEENKWALKITSTNYMFVVITPLKDGKYELKYMDAELKDYTLEEKMEVRNKYGIKMQSSRDLALKLMEHFGHYEWIEALPNKKALLDILTDATSFDLVKLRQLKEYKDLNDMEDMDLNSEKIESETYKLWARVGVTVQVSKEDVPRFLENQEKYIREGLASGKVTMDGETYFPEEVAENERFSKLYGELE